MRLRVIYVPEEEAWGVELDGRPAIRFQGANAHERSRQLADELRNRIADEMPWLEKESVTAHESH